MKCHEGTHKRKEPIMSDMAEKIGELKGKAEVKADEVKMKAGELKGKAEAKLDELKKDHEDQSK